MLVDFYRSDWLEIQAYIDNAFSIDIPVLYEEDKVEKITIDGLYMLSKPDLIKIVESNRKKSKLHAIKYVYDDIADGDSLEFGNSNWPYELITPIKLTSTALRVTHREVKRFEEFHGLCESNTKTPPVLPKVPPKKEENLLRTIGGLSLILAKQGRQWGTPKKPNVLAISREIKQLAMDLGVDEHGQSNSTLAKVIPAAIKLFRDE